MTREPVLTVASITALAAALVALIVSFGVPLTDDQQKALLGFVAVVAPLASGFLSRPRVTPVVPAHRSQVGASDALYLVLVVLLVVVLLAVFGVFR